MIVMTPKVDFKKIMLIIGLIAVVVLGMIYLLGGSQQTLGPMDQKVNDNDSRVKFLQSFGWEVVNSPKESSQVLIPSSGNQVFDRYNALQKCQGYDLSKFAGKKVMRYVYEVKNYPGATEPVLATLLIHKGKVIGGDVTNTAPNGRIQGFAMPQARPEATVPQTVPETTVPQTAPSTEATTTPLGTEQ